MAIQNKKPSKLIPGETAPSELWIDPSRLPTRLAQRNPLALASLPQVMHRLQSENEVQGNAKRRKPENSALRHWVELGDMLLKK